MNPRISITGNEAVCPGYRWWTAGTNEDRAGDSQLNRDHDPMDAKTRAEFASSGGARGRGRVAVRHDGSLRSRLWSGRTRTRSSVVSRFNRSNSERKSTGRGAALLLRDLSLRCGAREFWNLRLSATARWRVVKGTGSFYGTCRFPGLANGLDCSHSAVPCNNSVSTLGA